MSEQPIDHNDTISCSYLKEIAAAHGLTYEPQIVDDKGGPGNGGGGIGELIDMGEGCGPQAGFRPDLMDPSQAPRPAKIAPAFEPPMLEVQPRGESPNRGVRQSLANKDLHVLHLISASSLDDRTPSVTASAERFPARCTADSSLQAGQRAIPSQMPDPLDRLCRAVRPP